VLAALSFIGLHASLRTAGYDRFQPYARPVPPDQAAPVPSRLMIDADSYYWILFTQDAIDRHQVRIQHWTQWDHTPEGRPVWWSSGYSWWLRAIYHVRLCTAQADKRDLAAAAWWAGPTLLTIGILLIGGALTRFHSHEAARVAVLAMIALPQLYWTFFPGRADHHGLIVLFACAFMIATFMGIQRRSRSWMVLSAIAGALLIWTSAITGLLLLGCTAVAAAYGQLGSGPATNDFDPWPRWGTIGGLCVLVLYCLEFVPALPWQRLEIIHPLYALCWWGMGLTLSAFHFREDKGKWPWHRLAMGLCAISLLPIAVLAFGSKGYQVFLPSIFRMHKFIDEFMPYLQAVGAGPWKTAAKDFGALLPVIPLALYYALDRSLPVSQRGLARTACGVLLGLALLTLWQYRWASLFSVALISTLVALPVRDAALQTNTERGLYTLLMASLAGFLLFFTAEETRLSRSIAQGETLPRDLIRETIIRDIAHTVQASAGQRAIRAISNPPLAPALAFHGQIHGMASLYWENADGLDATVRFMMARTEKEAANVCREHEITHIIWMTNPSYLSELMLIERGAFDREALKGTFGYRLLTASPDLPDWLNAIPYHMPFPAFDGFPGGVRIYEVRIQESTPSSLSAHL